jgi:hypothetical protein
VSSQIIVYGFIEIPSGTEQENATTLAGIIEQIDPTYTDIASSISAAIPGWPSAMMPFARSFKKRGDENKETFVASFERVVYAMKASSAEIYIEDDEGLLDRHICYTYRPRGGYQGPFEWHRTEEA